MSDNLRLNVSDGIATLTLDAPPLNLVSKEMTEDLGRILDQCRDDRSIRALIVTGAGRAFCGGSDIKEFPDMMTPGAVVSKSSITRMSSTPSSPIFDRPPSPP